MAFIVNVNKDCSRTKRAREARSKAVSRTQSPKLIVRRLGQRHTWRRRSINKKMVTRLLHIKGEMKEIGEEQNKIKEGQRQVKAKVEAIESECRTLRNETMMIMRQSARTRLRLAFMFEILKARENNDFARAAELTHALRELIAEQNNNQQSFEPNDGDE